LLERHTRYLTLRPDVEALAARGARLRTAEAALTSTEDELRGVLATAMAVPGRGLDEGVADFLEGCRQHTLYEVAEAEGEEAARRRKLLLGEKSPGELRGQSDECDRRLAALVAANPELAGIEPDTGAGDIAKRLEGLQAESRALEVRVARLEEEVRSSLKDHRARAEIEEDAERWRREVTRLEAARAAAQMARDAISEAMVAVYRDFAPAVNAFLSEGFDYITEGRYQRAHVDPATLRVSLLLPETGRVITDPPVSRGTLTAAYILMRMGLAHHMSAIGESVPLVLDDPFVDLDGHRLERMLEFIMGISAGTQVLLFTKDRHIADWFKTMDADGRHALHLLAGSTRDFRAVTSGTIPRPSLGALKLVSRERLGTLHDDISRSNRHHGNRRTDSSRPGPAGSLVAGSHRVARRARPGSRDLYGVARPLRGRARRKKSRSSSWPTQYRIRHSGPAG
jgi:DNA repair exonuclease SbcCD ATPase subunit